MSITRRGVRYVVLVAIVLASTCLLYAKDWTVPPVTTESSNGYLSPSTVLPDYISPHDVSPCDTTSNTGRYVGTPSGEADGLETTKIESYIAQHLAAKQAHFNPQADQAWLGINLGAWDLPTYRQELMDTYRRYFSNDSTRPEYMHLVDSRLALRPRSGYPARPHQILTTTREMPMPRPFQRWRSLHRGYQIRIFDDERMARWVRDTFGGTRGKEVWDSLPRAVLKTDVFRYMALLVEGGIYTDTDTAPVTPITEWGTPYTPRTDPLLSLPFLSPSRSPDAPDEPSLVISVESDAIEFKWDDWRDVGLVRAVQIVQWTMAARPGHPVFMDAIGRTLRKTEELAAQELQAREKGEPFSPPSALEWTGPGVFTDCVYRYLLARWGFHPREMLHLKEPIMVGDVLILPSGSFHSVSPWEPREKWRLFAAVWHGFWGRWRADDGDALQRALENRTKEALGRE
ncbi:hypothetical protein NCC49_005994 [Naganishia albida]|nr:hypothetical protein NCC49_005994 [Naganishia albida]